MRSCIVAPVINHVFALLFFLYFFFLPISFYGYEHVYEKVTAQKTIAVKSDAITRSIFLNTRLMCFSSNQNVAHRLSK